jgi:hypothetical protein
MYPYSSDKAAHQARKLLRTASRVLGTVDPSGPVTGLLDGALPMPSGDPAYRSRRAFEPRFSETSSGSLAFSVQVPENGPAGSGGVSAASREVRHLLGSNFGRQALLWFDRNTDRPRSMASDGDSATVVSAFDRDGFREAQVTYLWGPWFTDGLPPLARKVGETVLTTVPGAEPAFTTVRAARQSGSQAMTFRLTSELPLASLRPMMDQLGLGQQHQSLMTAVAFALGARYTLPAGCCLLTFRPMRHGIELRLDVDLELVPDLPDNIADLLALELSERPRSLHALEHWVAAFSPEGEESPGSLSVLSVTVRPDMAARLSLHIRPRVVSDAAPSEPEPVPVGAGAVNGVSNGASNGYAGTAGWR